MKTIVTAKHSGGPFKNGLDGCHTRWRNGFCAGHETAEWLNSLGDDDAPYGTRPPLHAKDGHVITNGEVRLNWLSSDSHIVTTDRRRLELDQEIIRNQNTIRAARKELAALRKQPQQ